MENKKLKAINSYPKLCIRVILLAVIVILIIHYFIGISIKGGDFASYLEASKKMLEGTNIYSPPYIHLRYSYSPFWAMILMPLALLPIGVGVFFWSIINLLFLWRIIFIIRFYFNIKYDTSRRDLLLWTIIILFMSRFIELNFHHAQMTLFLLWIILESTRMTDNEIIAGILVGLGGIVKILPIVIIPYFIYRRNFKAAGFAILTIIIGFFLPIIYLGKDIFWELNNTWWNIIRPDNSDFRLDNTDYFSHNLSALLYRLLTATKAPYIKNLFDLDYLTATYLVWFLISLLIILSLYFLSTFPFKKIKIQQHVFYEISYITLLIPLIFPHQMKYSFCFLLPAVSCIVKFLFDNYISRTLNANYVIVFSLFVVALLLCTLTTDLILGMKYSIITQYLKTITIGTILLILALMLCKKHFVNYQ